jgi:hypothetical protein
MGAKYVTAENIAAKITRDYPGQMFDIADIIEWCAEAENNIGEFEAFEDVRDLEIEIKDRKALLPCNVWRLLNVKLGGCSIPNYHNYGTYLTFSDNSFTNMIGNLGSLGKNPPKIGTLKAHIDFIGIPIDPNTGYPLIMDGHQEACFWYCLKKMLFPDFLSGKIPSDRWQYIDMQYGQYVQKAKSSLRFTSRDTLNRIQFIKYNMVQRVRMGSKNLT